MAAISMITQGWQCPPLAICRIPSLTDTRVNWKWCSKNNTSGQWGSWLWRCIFMQSGSIRVYGAGLGSWVRRLMWDGGCVASGVGQIRNAKAISSSLLLALSLVPMLTYVKHSYSNREMSSPAFSRTIIVCFCRRCSFIIHYFPTSWLWDGELLKGPSASILTSRQTGSSYSRTNEPKVIIRTISSQLPRESTSCVY